MKKMTTILMAITLLICMASCEHDYPEEVTYTGSNTHGFKLNGEKWVRKSTGLNPSGCQYEAKIQMVLCDFFSVKENNSNYPFSSISFILNINQDSIDFPKSYYLSTLTDTITLDYEAPIYLDPTKCYIKFTYEEKQYERNEYSEIISGEMKILRFDSIFVGTFEAQLSNGIDTITITDGKLDYQLTVY